jgi:hypothetical protein
MEDEMNVILGSPSPQANAYAGECRNKTAIMQAPGY